MMKKISFLFLLVLAVASLLFIILSTHTITVTRYDETPWVMFEHEPDPREGNGLLPPNQWYDTHAYYPDKMDVNLGPRYEIDNGIIKIALLPEFGGRVSSFIYKPAGHDDIQTEQLYWNPIGTIQDYGNKNFFFDYLIVQAGILPTIGPEHGKYFFRKWEHRYKQYKDKVVFTLSRVDDEPPPDIDDEEYKLLFGTYDATGIVVSIDITLYTGSSVMEYQVTITNPTDQDKPFEYWTAITFVPGSPLNSETRSTKNARIVSPIEQVHLKRIWWDWMGNIEEPIPGLEHDIYQFEQLKKLTNWEDMGIGYAYPYNEANWYGVIDSRDNGHDFGFVRYNTDHDKESLQQGLKLWAWGKQSLNADYNDPWEIRRPYFELWSGITPEFFQTKTIKAGESISWTSYYYPTVGLENITTMNQHGAMYLKPKQDSTELQFYWTRLDSKLTIDVHLVDDIIAYEDVAVDPRGNALIIPAAENAIKEIVISDKNGKLLFK